MCLDKTPILPQIVDYSHSPQYGRPQKRWTLSQQPTATRDGLFWALPHRCKLTRISDSLLLTENIPSTFLVIGVLAYWVSGVIWLNYTTATTMLLVRFQRRKDWKIQVLVHIFSVFQISTHPNQIPIYTWVHLYIYTHICTSIGLS